MTWWTLDFGGTIGRQSFTTAVASPGQEQAAEQALRQASDDLGIPVLKAAFFESRGPMLGYFSPADPRRAWIRSGLGASETRRVALHEAGHRASWQLVGDVAGEDLPDGYAAALAAARALLDVRDRSGVRRVITTAVAAALSKHRMEKSR